MRCRGSEHGTSSARSTAALGERIAEERGRRAVSQKELAELTGTTQSAVSRLEGGGRVPRLDTLLRVANALDCTLEIELRPRTTIEGGSNDDGDR